MAKKEGTEDKIESIETALGKTEQYIEENRKSLTIIAGAIVAVVAIYFGFTKFYLKPREEKAESQMFIAEHYFDIDSFKLALNGDQNYPGFLSIIDDYRLTKSANLSNYYAGICYKNLGNYSLAIDYLKKFDLDDKLISSIALGSIGDCYSELNQNDDAVRYYERAADHTKNDFTSPIYLLRAGILLEQTGAFKKALNMYQRVEKEYNTSPEGQEISKYISRVKAEGHL